MLSEMAFTSDPSVTVVLAFDLVCWRAVDHGHRYAPRWGRALFSTPLPFEAVHYGATLRVPFCFLATRPDAVCLSLLFYSSVRVLCFTATFLGRISLFGNLLTGCLKYSGHWQICDSTMILWCSLNDYWILSAEDIYQKCRVVPITSSTNSC